MLSRCSINPRSAAPAPPPSPKPVLSVVEGGADRRGAADGGIFALRTLSDAEDRVAGFIHNTPHFVRDPLHKAARQLISALLDKRQITFRSRDSLKDRVLHLRAGRD